MSDRLALGWWIVTTCRDREAPRRGHGQEALDATLQHLADRGDSHAYWLDVRREATTASYVRVDLANGYRRSSGPGTRSPESA